MTQAEIDAAWLAYMHRSDLATELGTVQVFAAAKIANAMMFAPVDPAQLLEDQPQIWLHAGLCYLAELAQDDDQLSRETQLFLGAAMDYQMRRSLDGPAPVMQRGA